MAHEIQSGDSVYYKKRKTIRQVNITSHIHKYILIVPGIICKICRLHVAYSGLWDFC